MKTYKKEDDEIVFPFQAIDKMQVVQEAKSAFNESSINTRKCVFMITKILYLLGQGDTFNTTTATDLFFAATKLFISEDPKLRRMLYLLLKELSPFSEQTFVAINSLSKDMSSKNEEFKANAIRTLRKITDQSMVNALDRHFKQAVVDQSASVASAALVAGNRISDFNIELVKRWSNEVQSTVKSTHNMVQYHALALLYKLKKTDPLAVTKLISTNTSSFRSPLAHSLLIKYATKILKEENSAVGERSKTILKYLDSCLTYKNEIIMFEAAKAMCSLDYLAPKELTSAVTALQTFLSYSKPVYKFAAIRILNKLANKYPILASIGNSDMEALISDPNRNIATLAITTLLKTGNESNIDKLMKQISSFMSDIPDEFKIVVVDAMRALALQYPHKYQIMLNFLASSLREEGGYEFKKAIVDTIITVLNKIPESKEYGLSQLCEFIEDCEYTLLLQQVLHYLGNEGPKSQNPSRCIRYIYNRVILESAPVRASAVVSLARFAATVPALRQSIKVILKRTMQDNDDEVRDRAVFFLRILEQEDEEQIKKLIIDESSVDLAVVEKAVNVYVQHADFGNSFDITKAAEIKQNNGEAKQAKKQEAASTTTAQAPSSSKSTQTALLQKIPELAAYGTPFKVARATNLSEQDADYVVSCVKHIYKDHIVFQFIVTNKVETQKLRNVKVTMDLDSVEGISEDFLVQPGAISFDSSDSVFVSTSRTASKYVTGKIPCVLKFVVDTVDPESGEIEEQGEEDDEVDYDLEDLKLSMSDYIADKTVASFKELWETLGEAKEIGTATKENGKDNIQSTVDKLIIRSGLSPLNERKVPAKKTSHTLYFAGELTGGEVVLFAVQVSTEEGNGTTLKYAVRSPSEDARKRVLENLIKK